MDDPGGGGGGDFDVGDDVVAVVIRDESGQHIADVAGDVIGAEEEDEAVSTHDDAAVASGSNVIVDDSPLQNQMERNKECKFCCDVENILIHYSCGSSRSRH